MSETGAGAGGAGEGAGAGAGAADDKNQAGAGAANNTPPEGYVPGAKFQEVNKELKELKAKEAERAAAEAKAAEEKLLADKNYEELIKQKDAELNTAKELAQTTLKRSIFTELAIKEGIVSAADGFALADLSGITVDAQGNVQGMEDVVKALKESKPYLFGTVAPKPPVGSPSNPGAGGTPGAPGAVGDKPTHKYSDIKNLEYFRKNEADISKAFVEGRVLMGE